LQILSHCEIETPFIPVCVRSLPKKHARAELALFKKRKKIEAMGVEYDEEALASGEYDNILIN
jgi:uncharacterized protein with GYD domain